MKHLAGIFLRSVLPLIFFSCTKAKNDINEATEFNINYSTSLPIPSSSVSVNVPASFSTPDISTQSSARFASEKTSKELIDQIKLTKFNVSTNTGNLNFLKSLSIFIKADGLNELAVASKTLIAVGSNSFSAELSDVNIKEHIFKENIQFRVSVEVNTALATNQELKMDQTIQIKGKKIK